MYDKWTSDEREQSGILIVDDNPAGRILFSELIYRNADDMKGELL